MKRNWKRMFFGAAALLCMALMCARADAAQKKKLIMIVADKVSLRDVNDPGLFPNFHRAVAQGAMGLMITRTPSGFDAGGGYATLGAGRLTAGGGEASGHAYNADETLIGGQSAESAYRIRMGESRAALRGTDVLHLGLPALLRANGRNAKPGLLAETLAEHGYTTCVYGNADFGSEKHREAALIGMDTRGRIEHGDVAWRDLTDPKRARPLASVPDMEKLKNAFYEKYLRDSKDVKPYYCDLIIIDTGDTSRAESLSLQAEPYAAAVVRRKMLQRMDEFLGFALNAAKGDPVQIMFVSPTPPASAVGKLESMTPLVITGAGVKHGRLESSTTRRTGIVSNMDVAPYILQYFDVPVPESMAGAPVKVGPNGDSMAKLLRMQFLDAMRLRVGRLYQAGIAAALLVLLVAYLTMLRMPRVDNAWKNAVSVALTFTAVLFPAFVIAAAAYNAIYAATPAALRHYVLLLAAAGLLPGGVLLLVRDTGWRTLCAAAAYALLFLVDAATGGLLVRDSILGASPQYGAYFFGVEDISAALLIGAMPVAAALAFEKIKIPEKAQPWAIAAGPIIAAIVIGLPPLGANTAALLPACAAAAVFAVLNIQKQFRAREIILSAVAAALGFGIVALVARYGFHAARPPFERTIESAVLPGGLYLWLIAFLTRLSANFTMITEGSVWSAFFVALTVTAITIYFFPNNRMRWLIKRHPGMGHALMSALAASAVSLVFIGAALASAAAILFIPVTVLFLFCVAPYDKKASAQDKRASDRKPEKPRPPNPPAGKPAEKKPAPQPSSGQRPRPDDREKRNRPPRKKPFNPERKPFKPEQRKPEFPKKPETAKTDNVSNKAPKPRRGRRGGNRGGAKPPEGPDKPST